MNSERLFARKSHIYVDCLVKSRIGRGNLNLGTMRRNRSATKKKSIYLHRN